MGEAPQEMAASAVPPRYYLDYPFADKERYVPTGVDVAPFAEWDPRAPTSSSTESVPAGRRGAVDGAAHSVLVTVSYRFSGHGAIELEGTRREVDTLAATHAGEHAALVCETPTIDEVRVGLRGALVWWYAGAEVGGRPIFATKEGGAQRGRFPDGVLPLHIHPSHAPRDQPTSGLLYVLSVEEVVRLVHDATADRLRLVVLNTCNTLPLAQVRRSPKAGPMPASTVLALPSSARLPLSPNA